MTTTARSPVVAVYKWIPSPKGKFPENGNPTLWNGDGRTSGAGGVKEYSVFIVPKIL